MHQEDKVLPALLCKLDDSEFHHQFELTASVEHSSTMKMLHFINDLERRKSYLDLGYSSVFDYCVRKIKYSSSQAGRRIQAARCCRRYPEAWAYLREREVCVMTLAMIESVITDDNKDEIFRRVRGASRREVERLMSEYRPASALRDRIRYIQLPGPLAADIDRTLFERKLFSGSEALVCRQRCSELQSVYVQFLADSEFLELFEEVQALMSNREDTSFSAIMKTVLAEYRDRHSPAARHERRAAKTESASPDSHRWECEDATPSRHIPDAVRDEIFVRDEGRCTFVATDGTRCQCTRGLQVDHIKPFANGGTHDPSNLRLLCGAHNRREAERTMGAHVMQGFWRTQ